MNTQFRNISKHAPLLLPSNYGPNFRQFADTLPQKPRNPVLTDHTLA